MLYIVFMLLVLLPVLAGWGRIFSRLFGVIFTGISFYLLAGIFSVAVAFSLLSFFVPLNIYVEGGTLVVGLLSFFYYKVFPDFRLFIARNALFFIPLSLVTILFGSYFPFVLDHFGYYVPTIKWLSEVGLVRGISNLDLLLGQMSVWHIFQAGFSNFSDPFLRINVLMLLVYLVYIFERQAWLHFIFLPFLFFFCQSPSPDLPVIVISLMLLNEFLNFNKKITLLFVFSVFVFAIKPTMVWLPLFALLYGMVILKARLKFIFPGILLLLLFFIKNIWTFGFPIFPLELFDFGISWKPNAELLRNSAEMAIMKTYDMQYAFSEIERFSKLASIKNWLFLSGMKGKIHFAFLLGLIAFLLFCVKKKSRILWLLFISVLFKSILVLLFSAQYRFFLDVFFVIVLVIFYETVSKKISLITFSCLSFLGFVFLSFPGQLKDLIPSFKLGSFMTGFNTNQFYKPSHFELKKYETHQIGNLKFNVVQDYPFSFDTPLPAISPAFIQEDVDAGIFPQLKGNSLKDGFIWRKISPDEKEKLKIILKDLPR